MTVIFGLDYHFYYYLFYLVIYSFIYFSIYLFYYFVRVGFEHECICQILNFEESNFIMLLVKTNREFGHRADRPCKLKLI